MMYRNVTILIAIFCFTTLLTASSAIAGNNTARYGTCTTTSNGITVKGQHWIHYEYLGNSKIRIFQWDTKYTATGNGKISDTAPTHYNDRNDNYEYTTGRARYRQWSSKRMNQTVDRYSSPAVRISPTVWAQGRSAQTECYTKITLD